MERARRIGLLAAVFVTSSACGSPGASTKPKTCTAAAAYEGPPLGPSIRPESFMGTRPIAGTLPDDAGLRLDAALDTAAAKMRIASITAAIATADGRAWTATRSIHVPPPARFWWASTGKAFTAMVVMQLVEEGRLRLDTPLATFDRRVANADVITVDHLLTHTGGVYSFQNDDAFRARSGHISPASLVDVASAHEPVFCPGAEWAYSNTGYVLLGKMIEAVDGGSYHASVNRRIFAPLAPAKIAALAPGADEPDIALPEPGIDAERAHHDLTTPFAAGVIAGTSLDMIRAWQRFLAGEVVPPERVTRMFERVYPMFGARATFYGEGVMVYDLASAGGPDKDIWLGHTGGMPGAKSVVAWSTERRAFVAVSLTGEGSPEATALSLLKAL